MACVVHVTPLFAGGDEPYSTLLKIDDFTILLDCGWDERFDEQHLSQLQKILPDIDAVLITYPDIKHLGALPYLVKHNLDVPIYCTKPVKHLGAMFLYDAVLTRSQYFKFFEAFTLDDVDAIFQDRLKNMICVEPSQPVQLTEKGEGITICPSSNGHMLGGACWKIMKETQEILYAVNIKHFKETHLEGTTVEAFGSQVTMLITDARNALTDVPKIKTRTLELKKKIVETLLRGGSVLLPTDAAGRVLELLFVLHAFWVLSGHEAFFRTKLLVLMTKEGEKTIEIIEKLTEYMTTEVSKGMTANSLTASTSANENMSSFFPKLHYCSSKQQLDALRAKHRDPLSPGGCPCVVLASSSCMYSGSLAQDVFMDFHASLNNLILFTERPPLYSSAHKLLEMNKPTQNVHARMLEIERPVNYQLTGVELAMYREREKLEKEQSMMDKQKLLAGAADGLDDDDEGEGMDHDIDDDNAKTTTRKQSKSASHRFSKYPMYEYKEPVKNFDDYGEIVDIEMLQELVQKQSAFMMEDPYFNAHTQAGARTPVTPVVVPSKTVLEKRVLKIESEVAFIDFEGLSDGRSLKNIISKIKPRKLCLINGSEQCKDELMKYCVKENVCKKDSIYTPKANELVDVTSETSRFRVMAVHPSLAKALSFPFQKSIGGFEYELGYADVLVKIDYAQSSLPVLLPAPADMIKGHSAVFLGDLGLSDMKKLLNQKAIKADIINGVIVCSGGAVNIRKVTKTRISIQGALCDDYFKIRKLLYGFFEII